MFYITSIFMVLLLAPTAKADECLIWDNEAYEATDWYCAITVKGKWAEDVTSSMCGAHGSKKKYFEPGTEAASDFIRTQPSSFKDCQAKYEEFQKLIYSSQIPGDSSHYHQAKQNVRERGPLNRTYYRSMSVESVSCKFYPHWYQGMLF